MRRSCKGGRSIVRDSEFAYEHEYYQPHCLLESSIDKDAIDAFFKDPMDIEHASGEMMKQHESAKRHVEYLRSGLEIKRWITRTYLTIICMAVLCHRWT